MDEKQLWQKFCKDTGTDESTPYTAWAFGGAPDELAALVLIGEKTGTASAYDLYAIDESEPMPEEGDISVILNSREQAVCVIQTTCVTILPFYKVPAEHAFAEGEGDKSLAYWRKVHWDFFSREFEEFGLTFDENKKVVCERFRVLYKA